VTARLKLSADGNPRYDRTPFTANFDEMVRHRAIRVAVTFNWTQWF
jgi:hypothetical protein